MMAPRARWCVCKSVHTLMRVAIVCAVISVVTLSKYVFFDAKSDEIAIDKAAVDHDFFPHQTTLAVTNKQVATASHSAQTPKQSAQSPSHRREVLSYFNRAFKRRVPERVVITKGGNIHFSLRTGSHSYKDRLPIVFLTWIQTIPPQNVHILTDRVNASKWSELASLYGFKFIASDCGNSHNRPDLWCKTVAAFEEYFQEMDRGIAPEWFCHCDDDMYCNVPAISDMLENEFKSSDRVFVGSGCYGSMPMPKEVVAALNVKNERYRLVCGAMYCLSRPLLKDLEPHMRGNNLNPVVKELLNTDLGLAVYVGPVLGVHAVFHKRIVTHINDLSVIPFEQVKNMAAISYGDYLYLREKRNAGEIGHTFFTENHVIIPNATFTLEEDPTRFLSYHCFLFPSTSWCHQ